MKFCSGMNFRGGEVWLPQLIGSKNNGSNFMDKLVSCVMEITTRGNICEIYHFDSSVGLWKTQNIKFSIPPLFIHNPIFLVSAFGWGLAGCVVPKNTNRLEQQWNV